MLVSELKEQLERFPDTGKIVVETIHDGKSYYTEADKIDWTTKTSNFISITGKLSKKEMVLDGLPNEPRP